ncbi:GH25 family lysozyme [Arthrobacter sp.]|uniref:GH25 family lysozyme n=1 Tax=Arthrobacter sp. TaxID=1667 RepID=UPI0026DF5003|nr:GH25 family lysozyme [Arthrobacter sp.]MDO5751485.1 GH25 family lysozyme [Arthrobacter sp.]
MGQGISKQSRGIALNSPMTMRGLVDEVATAQVAATLAVPAGIAGMDVSGWQADPSTHSVSQVNWTAQWSKGSRFVYAKATEGSYFVDGSHNSHLSGARGVGMLTGAYHFAIPAQSSATVQADFFIRNGGAWKAGGSTLPPLLDIENNPYTNPASSSYYGNTCYNMTPAAMVAWISEFSNRVLSQTGRLPMIYTNYYWWQECTGNSQAFTNQPLHIAAYTNSSPWIPGGWNTYSMWQFSDNGPFAGDSNVWNGTLDALKLFAASSGTADSAVSGPSIPSPADLVAVDSSGALWNYPKAASGKYGARQQIGRGWSGLRSLNVIDWDADGFLDILAQWDAGNLSVYRGLPTGGFATALTLAGTGWADKQLTVGYWLNTSSRPQILAKSADGTLRMWTTNSADQISNGSLIGQGWGKFNLTMVDFDGDRKQDLVAQDPEGDLYLYRSNGAGAFINESRSKIGHGWADFTSVTVSSDFTAAGSVGLVARNRNGALSYYPVPGNSTFGSPLAVGTGWGSYQIAGGDTINTSPPAVQPPVQSPSIAAASDVVTADSSGRLWRHATKNTALAAPVQIGTGFTKVKSLHVTDWNADGVLDLLVQWSSGKLALYRGYAGGGFAASVLAESGWAEDNITVGRWENGSKFPTIIAATKSGDLTSRTTTAGAAMGAAKILIKGLTRSHPAIIDFDSDGKPDLAVVDNIGRLFLYRSNGNGALQQEGRALIGHGWNNMLSVGSTMGSASAKSQGLLARNAAGDLLHYPVANSGFGATTIMTTGWVDKVVSGSPLLNKKPALASVADSVSVDSVGTAWTRSAPGNSTLSAPFPVASGWKGAKSVHVTDWNADGNPDALVQWLNGTMDVFPSLAQGGFGNPIRVGYSGWQNIEFTVSKWNAGDKYPSVLGRTQTGDLMRWGNSSGQGLGAAVRIGKGWASSPFAVADFDCDGRVDVLVVDKSGALLLYRTNGLGAFTNEPRRVIGGGWTGMSKIVGISGFSGSGSAGVMATQASGALVYYPIVTSGTWGTPVVLR